MRGPSKAAPLSSSLSNGNQSGSESEMKRKIGIIAGIVVLGAIGVVGFLHFKSERHTEAPRKFPVTSAWKTNQDITKLYVGQIRAIQHIELRALERGYLNDIF